MKRKLLKIIGAGVLAAAMFFAAGAAVCFAQPPKALASPEKPEIFVQLGHSNSIKSAAFTSEGAYLVSGSEDRTVKIWESATGKEIRTLRHDGEVKAIALSPDNKMILAGDAKGTVTLWETATGKAQGKLAIKQMGSIESLAFSPGGRHAVATDFFKLVYFDVAAKKEIFVLDRGQDKLSKDLADQVNVATFTRDSRHLVLGIKKIDGSYKGQGISIGIYDIKRKKRIKNFDLLKGDAEIYSIAVSPDEKHFLVSASVARSKDIFEKSGKVFVVDAQNGGILKEFSFPEPFFEVACSPTGQYAAIANHGEIILYETNHWNVARKIRAHLPIAFSPDGQSLIYGNDNTRAYYGQWVHKTGLDLMDLKTGNSINRYAANVDQMTEASFTANEKEIMSRSWILLNWDKENGILKKPLILRDAANNMITASAASPDGKYMIVGNDQGTYIYSAADGRMRPMWDKPIFRPDFTADGKTLFFSTYDRKIILWDIENNRQIRQFADWGRREQLYIDYNKITPDGRYAVVLSHDYEQPESKNNMIVWDADTGKEIRRSEIKNSIFSLLLSPDSRHILTGESQYGVHETKDKHVTVLRSITDNRIVKRFPGHTDMIKALAFSRNGQFILTGSWDQQILLWEAKSGRRIKTFTGHAGIIYTLEFSSDNKNFVSTSNDNTVRLWDIAAGREIAQFISFVDGEWIVITPEGYFNASPGGAKHLSVRLGNRIFPIDNLYETFFDPIYVASVLQGKKVEATADIRKGIQSPPEVRILSPSPGAVLATDTVTIQVGARDTGGGIEEIRLYHNGKALGGDQRGLKLVSRGGETVRDFQVTLVDGANTFRAVGFSSDRTESNPYEMTVLLSAPSKEVSLYVLAVGINKYRNPALNLNYAVPDARGIAGFFRRSQRLFKKVTIWEIYDEEATKEGILAKLRELEKTHPQDAVLIYLAGHGENVKDVWYFIPHELTYPEREEAVQTKGISSIEFSASMKNIRAQKILLLVDACKSGAVLVAFRGFEDRKALSQLSRSTGTHVVAASTKDQFAAEVRELGHGVFTYTLLEGLKGKAAGGSDTVTVRRLMGYIEEQLPEISKKYKQEAQFPVVDSRGMDFPLVIMR
jgi:WD40 repeat protein